MEKTAGSSIEIYLSQHCGENDIVTPLNPPDELHEPRNYKGLFNPFTEMVAMKWKRKRRTIEHFFSGIKYFNHIPAKLIKKYLPAEIWDSYYKFCVERNSWDKTLSHYYMKRNRSGGRLSLDEYFSRGEFPVSFQKYTNDKGEIIVDRVVRNENLNQELSEVFNHLGIPFDGSLHVHAKSEFRKDKRPYQEVLNEKQRLIIETHFRKEIELHGYKF